MMTDQNLAPNALAFLALSNEYCHAIENSADDTPYEFVDHMLRLLPRIYISASDINADAMCIEVQYLPPALDEDNYNTLRATIENLLGENDTYLEVFEDDMKYSDTPIAASIAEELCDIFQELYNMLENCKESTNDVIAETIALVKEEFSTFWSQKLCNVLRALNAIKYNADLDIQ